MSEKETDRNFETQILQELGSVWKDFEDFKDDSLELIKEIKADVERGYGDKYESDDREALVEAATLFHFGLEDVHRLIGYHLDPLRPEVVWSMNGKVLAEVIRYKRKVRVGVNIEHLLTIPSITWFIAGGAYRNTIIPGPDFSPYLSNRRVLDILFVPPEESGHKHLEKLKQRDTVRQLKIEYELLDRVSKEYLKHQGLTARVYYHTSDIERRGLIWKMYYVYKRFPSLYPAFREHWEDVNMMIASWEEEA